MHNFIFRFTSHKLASFLSVVDWLVHFTFSTCGGIQVVRQGPRVLCACPRYAPHAYWITSSAQTRNDGGIVIPSALAVLRLRAR